MIQLRLHHKITLSFVLIITCLFLGIFVHIKQNIRQFTYQNIRAHMLQKTSLAKAFVERAQFGMDLNDLADQIGRDLRLRVTIIDEGGSVKGDSDVGRQDIFGMENHLDRQEIQGSLRAEYGESRRFSTSVKQDFLYMATRYRRGNEQGFVRLAIPLDEIAAVSQRVSRILIISFIFAFIFSVVASYLASLLISKRIEMITKGAHRIASGNFDNRIFVSGNDEIGDLAKTFNEMAEQIRDRLNEIAVGKLQLEAVFSSMSEGVLVVDGGGRIFLMNQALRSLLKIDHDPIGKRPLEVIRNADIQDMITRIESGEDQGSSQEISFFAPEQRVIRVQSAPVRKIEGGPSGAVLVFHDITELRRLENIRKEFVANVSHELRTPAASIKGYAETLIDGALDDKENAADFVRIISEEADRLAKLIEDLLDLSSIESGKMLKIFSQCRLDTILNKAIMSIQGQAKGLKINIQVHGPKEIVIKGDELGLYRMFLNLVENAVKYNKENGRVDIFINQQNDTVEVQIQDTGIGIPEEDLPRIFERFYRVDKARSRQLGGTGLGLAIVKHIVQAHGGNVSVESVLDQGSKFTVILPLSNA